MPTMSLREAANGLRILPRGYDDLNSYIDPAIQDTTPQEFSRYVDWARVNLPGGVSRDFGYDYSPLAYWQVREDDINPNPYAAYADAARDPHGHMGDEGKKLNHMTHSVYASEGTMTQPGGYWAEGQRWPQVFPPANMLRYYTRSPNTFWPGPNSSHPYANLLPYFREIEQDDPNGAWNVMPPSWSGSYLR